MQMVIPESDLSTLEKVDASSFNVTTYKAAFTKQVIRHDFALITFSFVSLQQPLQSGSVLECHYHLRHGMRNLHCAQKHSMAVQPDTILTCLAVLLQEVKELVRGTRQAVGSNFLGSLESFLVYLESLMGYCRMFLADSAAESIMKVWPTLRHNPGKVSV